MKVEEAIKKAVEGGFARIYPDRKNLEDALLASSDYWGLLFVDPLFWQSLGNALGWDGKVKVPWEHYSLAGIPSWEWHWHDFVHHLAEGKTAEEFFASAPEF